LPLQKVLRSKVKKFAKLLGVSDYSCGMTLFDAKKASEAYTTYGFVIIDEESHEAVVNLNKRLIEKQPDETDSTIIHELLHIRLSELLNLVSSILNAHVKEKKVKKVYIKQLDRLEHKIIVALTNALVKR